MAGKPTLKDISRLTNFSTTTVSMVLNGRSDEFNIAEKTRDKIIRAARELNYKPNLHARNLRNKTSNILGLMVPTLSNRFFAEIAESFERLARKDNKIALITSSHFDAKDELDTVEYFISQKADCIFTVNPTALREVNELCSDSDIRQIVLDSPANNKNTVTTDNFEAARVLTRNLLSYMKQSKQGGRAYYLGGVEAHAVTRLRVQGYNQALEDLGVAVEPDLFIQCEFTQDAAYQAMKGLLESRKDVGGLFVNSLKIMEGVIRYFKENPQVCRSLHYGVFDYNPIMSLLELDLLSVMQNSQRMMEKAYEIYKKGDSAGHGEIFYIPYTIHHSAATAA